MNTDTNSDAVCYAAWAARGMNVHPDHKARVIEAGKKILAEGQAAVDQFKEEVLAVARQQAAERGDDNDTVCQSTVLRALANRRDMPVGKVILNLTRRKATAEWQALGVVDLEDWVVEEMADYYDASGLLDSEAIHKKAYNIYHVAIQGFAEHGVIAADNAVLLSASTWLAGPLGALFKERGISVFFEHPLGTGIIPAVLDF